MAGSALDGEGDGARSGRRSGDGATSRARRWGFDPEELRRRNASAVAMDLLYLFTTGFFTYLALEGPWPAAIAAVPLVTLLYFGARSSAAFLLAQALAMALTVIVWFSGVIPL